MADSQTSGDYGDVVSRRKFVSIAGSTGAAAFAGCIGGDGDDGGSDDGGSDGGGGDNGSTDGGGSDASYDYEHEDIWFETAETVTVNTFQYNTTPGAGNVPDPHEAIFAQWAFFNLVNNEFVPHLIADWEHPDESTLVLTLSEEFTWGSSGESITAEDLLLQLEIESKVGDVLFDFVESIDDVEATGEYELTLNYPESTRNDFVRVAALNREAAFSPSIWEDERDNDSPAEVDVQVPDPSGPLALTNQESNYAQYEPRNQTDEYEDDPVAGDHFNWNGYRSGNRDANAMLQSMISEDLDGRGSIFVGPESLEQFPESVQQYQIPTGFGMGIWPAHNNEPWNIREVRQALYYSIDRGAVIENVGSSTKINHTAPTGLTYPTIEEHLGADEPEGFNVYSFDQERAESLLDEAGYEMGDISATFTYPQAWSDWAVAAQAVVEQLQNVGWDISGNGASEGPGTYVENLGDNFDLAADLHTQGGARSAIPYFSLRHILRNTTRSTEEHFAGYTKNEVEIDGNTINIDETLDALSTAQDEDEQNELIRDLALIVNKDVPVIYVMAKTDQSWINGRRFDAPTQEETDRYGVMYPMWYFPQVEERLETASEEATPGLLKARTN